MKTNEFFYWLQGYFELRNADEPLTPAQAECITRHAALVRASLPKGESPEERVYVIDAFAKSIVRMQDVPSVVAYMTAEICKELAAQFEHVIDPQAGDAEQQAKLNAIHHQGGPERPVYRC